MLFLFAEKDWKHNRCSYTVHERYVFDSRSLSTANKKACDCFSHMVLCHCFHLELGTYFFTPNFISTLITNFVQSTVFGLARRPVGLARFSSPRILKPLDRQEFSGVFVGFCLLTVWCAWSNIWRIVSESTSGKVSKDKACWCSVQVNWIFCLGSFFWLKKNLGLPIPDLNVCSRVIERGIRSDEWIRFIGIRSKVLTW